MTENAISDLVGTSSDTPAEPEELKEAPKEPEETPKDPVSAEETQNSPANTENSDPAVSTADPKEVRPMPLESQSATSSTSANTESVHTKNEDSPVPTANITEPDPTAPTVDAVMEKLKSYMGTHIGESSSCKVLIHSEPGGTKSSIAATAAYSLLWDFEDGLMSAAESPYGIAEGIVPMSYVNFVQAEAIVTKFEEHHPDLDWCKVFTIDTYSDFVRRTLADICERDWRAAPSLFNRYKPNTDQYTENNEMHDRFVRRLRDLDRDLLIFTHSKTVEPKNKPAKTYPDFSESYANKLEAKMDVVGYIQWQEVDSKAVPVMLTKSTTIDLIHCKRRIDIPDIMPNPTWPDIRAGWERTQARIKAMQNGTKVDDSSVHQ